MKNREVAVHSPTVMGRFRLVQGKNDRVGTTASDKEDCGLVGKTGGWIFVPRIRKPLRVTELEKREEE